MRMEQVVNTPAQLEELVGTMSRFKLRKPVRVVIEHYVPPRTPEQNSRHRAIVAQSARELGYAAEELHEELLCECFGYTIARQPGGGTKRVPKRRSSELNMKEFSDFMDFSESYLAAELGMTFA